MNPQLSEISPGESWQSEQNLHAREEFTELCASVHSAAQIVLQFLHISYEALELTGCWANVNSSGVAHAMHSHPNNFLSGVYYVQTQPGADTVNFHDPRPQTGVIRPPVTELTAENTDRVVVNVSNGTLLMFTNDLSEYEVPVLTVNSVAKQRPRWGSHIDPPLQSHCYWQCTGTRRGSSLGGPVGD